MKILGLHIIRHKKLQQARTAMYRAGLHKNKELLDNAIAENAQLVAELRHKKTKKRSKKKR